MDHREVLEWFKFYFPQYEPYIKTWFQNGKNSIRVRQANGDNFVFTYNNSDDWSFETEGAFIRRLNERRKTGCV